MTPLGIWRLARIAALLAVCLVAFGIVRLFGPGTGLVRFFLRRVGHILGLRVRIEGQALGDHVLYVANHISWLDILALGGATGTRFVAKSEIERWPLIGWLATLGGVVYVARERRSATRAQADQVAGALAEGVRPVTLFAEGGTGDGRTLMPFRAPLFVAATEAGAVVQPVAVDYGSRRVALAWPDGVSLATEMKRLFNRREIVPVTLRFLDPIDARRHDRKILAARSHEAIAAALT